MRSEESESEIDGPRRLGGGESNGWAGRALREGGGAGSDRNSVRLTKAGSSKSSVAARRGPRVSDPQTLSELGTRNTVQSRSQSAKVRARFRGPQLACPPELRLSMGAPSSEMGGLACFPAGVFVRKPIRVPSRCRMRLRTHPTEQRSWAGDQTAYDAKRARTTRRLSHPKRVLAHTSKECRVSSCSDAPLALNHPPAIECACHETITFPNHSETHTGPCGCIPACVLGCLLSLCAR